MVMGMIRATDAVGEAASAALPRPSPIMGPPHEVAVQDKTLHRGEVVESGVAAASAADRAQLYLSSMDFVLTEGISDRWCTKYGELVAWHREHGTCSVPKSQGQLGRWVARQRELHKRDELEPAREHALNRLGIVWDTAETQWELRIQQLMAYRAAHGTACVPIADGELGAWTAKQRQLHAKGRLLPSRYERLAELGFVFNMPASDWDAQVSAMVLGALFHVFAVCGGVVPFCDLPLSSADHRSRARNVLLWCGLRVCWTLLVYGGALSTTAWWSGRPSMATRGCRLSRASLGGG